VGFDRLATVGKDLSVFVEECPYRLMVKSFVLRASRNPLTLDETGVIVETLILIQ
jgi:hypothetical protein